MGSRTDRIEEKRKNEPSWECRIEGDIKKLRQNVDLLTRELKGEWDEEEIKKMKELYEKYRVKKKGLKTMVEELKQRMLAKSAKVKTWRTRAYQGMRNVRFSKNLACFVFLKHSF